tara:strand:+ start:339 stop:542 length:204 start_codon:yes stop_codon:yes gene_type:complete
MTLLFFSALITTLGVIIGTCALKEAVFRRRVEKLHTEWESSYGAEGGFPIFEHGIVKAKSKAKRKAG